MFMFRREKVLLYLILQLNKLGVKVSKTQLDKLLFVLKKETSIDGFIKFYNFFPYNYGPFSNQFYFDLNELQKQGFLTEDFELTATGEKVSGLASKEEKQLVDGIVEKYGNYPLANLKDYVYAAYPEYTVKSVLKSEVKQVKEHPAVFSIGYEKKDIDLFLDLLIKNGVEVVVDVRANAFSMNFVFTKTKLAQYLEKVGITYLHVPELGISGEHRKDLKTEENYRELFEFYASDILPKQGSKLSELISLGKSKRIALLCFEQDNNHCHRGALSKELEKTGIAVTHL